MVIYGYGIVEKLVKYLKGEVKSMKKFIVIYHARASALVIRIVR